MAAPPSAAPLAEPKPYAYERVRLPDHPVRATWALIAVNVVLFALETFWGGSQWSPILFRMGANTGRGALASEPWRILASAFLHIGPVHLLANMWALSVFGRSLERLLGSARLLVLYGISALGGGLLSALHSGERLAAGASGAVWGLMLAELVLLFRPRSLFEDLVFTVNKLTVLQPLALNLLISLQPGIDLLGHLGGGLAGALVMGSRLLAQRPRAAAWRGAAAGASAAMGISVALALLHGRPWELRAPRLEPRSLAAFGMRLALPRGLPLHAATDGDDIVFGDVTRDGLAVECGLSRLPRALDPTAQESLLQELVRDWKPEDGWKGAQAPQVVTAAGRRAFHVAQSAPNGARIDSWSFVEDVRVVRLDVVRLGDEPEAWSELPARIAESVTFLPAAAAPAR